MGSSNIAVVIGPNIVRPPEISGSPESFVDYNSIVQLLVDNFEDLYPEVCFLS